VRQFSRQYHFTASFLLHTNLNLENFTSDTKSCPLVHNPLIKILVASISDACTSIMDPLTVLSVAGSVVQFADFSMKLFADGRELYKSTRGILTAHEELELVTVDLRALIVKVKQVPVSEVAESENQGDRDGEASFGKIYCDATKLAEELIDALDKLKLREGKNRIWESFRKVIESAWSRDQIKSLSKRLESLKRAAETYTLFSIR
jgi:hypothetical protein